MRLTLLIPELLWSEPGNSEAYAAADASQLAKFLAQRRPALQSPVAARPWEHALLDALGVPTTTSLAALRAQGDGLDLTTDTEHWLCADPVHLRFSQNRLILADASELALDSAETDALTASVNAQLAPLELRFASPKHGYVRLSAPVQGQLVALSQKVGCEVRLDDLACDPRVRQINNELQMLLHAHPVNQAREAAGRPTVNALWLWGEGSTAKQLPGGWHDHSPRSAPKIPHLISHGEASALLAGLARQQQGSHETLSGTLTRSNTRRADTLVFSTLLMHPAHYQDSAAFGQAWAKLDRELLSPALMQLRRGQVKELQVIAPTVFGELRWSCTPWAARLAPLKPFSSVRLSGLAASLAPALGEKLP